MVILSKPRNSSIDRQKILWMQIRVMSDYICEEVVVQILLTRSSKSLIEFKLVCRLCYSPILKYTLFSIKNADRSKLILRHYDTPNHKGRFTLHYNAESGTKQFKIDLRLGLGKMMGLRKNEEVLLVTRHNGELVAVDTVNWNIHRLGINSDAWTFAWIHT
ncbi:hypothetical protein WN944_028724 [Citrus x changshan-huyou]|uniref:Uncharacterized protein n=1 Tax=Citrus x changshan-huyou TaxID=2935761 RepID=A0AAP0Q9P8_9ROSI